MSEPVADRPIAFDLAAPQCERCAMLIELWNGTDRSPRLYWVMTEIFVFLHGSDVCDIKKGSVQ